MRFVEFDDLGDTPEHFVSGIAAIVQVGPNTIRLTFFSARDGENRAVHHQIWDCSDWFLSAQQFRQALETMQAAIAAAAAKRQRVAAH